MTHPLPLDWRGWLNATLDAKDPDEHRRCARNARDAINAAATALSSNIGPRTQEMIDLNHADERLRKIENKL